MAKKIIMFAIIVIVFSFCWRLGVSYFEPQVSTSIAVGQANYDSTQAQAAMRAYSQTQPLIYGAPFTFGFVLFVVMFGRDILAVSRKMWNDYSS